MLLKSWKYSPQISLLYKGLPNDSSEEVSSVLGEEEKGKFRWSVKHVVLIVLAFFSLSFNMAGVFVMVKGYRDNDKEHHLLKSFEIFSDGKEQSICLWLFSLT